MYEQWLVNAFDIWFDHYPHIPLRTFEALLDVCAGLPSGTDAFGFGDVSLLSIETDGTYHDLDVLKVTQDGATRLIGSVLDTPIADVAQSQAIEQHRRYLRKEGLSEACQSCGIVDICGGGSLPHRFGQDGFVNPTVYCNEMKRLVAHITERLNEHLSEDWKGEEHIQLPDTFDLAQFELAETSAPHLGWLITGAEVDAVHGLHEALDLYPKDPRALQLRSLGDDLFALKARQAGAIAWAGAAVAQSRGHALLAVDGQPIHATSDYLVGLLHSEAQHDCDGFSVAKDDLWLRAPFGTSIYFEGKEIAAKGKGLVCQAMAIVKAWRPALASEMQVACTAIQFIRDTSADPRKIVSFSDNSVPGALYVSISQGDRLIDPYDLADSLIHEHRHQKLYLLERYSATVQHTSAHVVSPWREDLRPPSGLLHAVFVFVELRRFWLHVREHGPIEMNSRAINQISDTDQHLQQAFETLKECPLTDVGQHLVKVLRAASTEGITTDEFAVYRPAVQLVG
ncbi:HEXXH motif-containing putative peptide modification protein [Pseudomonas viridiflava]|nr:HEXXH motif-containing putative peptide modification protein [Pseudomonas viridiflava]